MKDLLSYAESAEFVNNDPASELYMDGTIAQEVEHLLVMRLHPLNTIQEIETLKYRIHQMMQQFYEKGQDRTINDE